MVKVEIYSSGHCSYCTMAKQLLDRKGIYYTEILVDQCPNKLQEIMKRGGQHRTLPQIFIDDKAIGGYDDLLAIDKIHELDGMLGV